MLDLKQLEKRCLADRDDFLLEGDDLKCEAGLLVYANRGNSRVLGIAHTDFVGKNQHFCAGRNKAGDELLFAPNFDDRLGVYLLLDYLPTLGVDCDILLTDNEEKGQSTAGTFEMHPENYYNWIFMFDRHGTDVVMYQYETEEYAQLLKDAGFTVGIGSGSCISKMSSLGVAGFNFGTGYHDEHTYHSYACPSETEAMAKLFAKFYHANKGNKFVHDPSVTKRKVTYYQPYTQTNNRTGAWDAEDWRDWSAKRDVEEAAKKRDFFRWDYSAEGFSSGTAAADDRKVSVYDLSDEEWDINQKALMELASRR